MMKFVVTICMLLCAIPHNFAYANDNIVIDVPPPPPLFPTEFPRYTKCSVGGKRQACYDLKEIKQLLLLWHRYNLLQKLPDIAKQQQEIIKTQHIISKKKDDAIALYKKANASQQASIKALRDKIDRDEKRRKADAIRNAVIIASVVVVAVGAAAIIGYFVKR